MEEIVVLSLFDGMSCGQIALKESGINVKTYYACEIDKYAIHQTQHNFPDTIQLGSVTDVHAIDLPKIDLMIGGSPCQGFSFAGKQLNFKDPRSALFFEYVRIWDEVKKINPDAKFLLENVNMKKEYLRVISEYLGVFPVRINSNLVSAQNRDRWYWSNIRTKETGLFDELFSDIPQPYDKKINLNDILEDGFYSDSDKSYCIDANYAKGTNFRRYYFCGSRQLVLANGYSPGNMTKETANDVMHKDGNQWRKLSVSECCKLQTIPTWYKWIVPTQQQYKLLGNGWTIEVIKHIFSFLK